MPKNIGVRDCSKAPVPDYDEGQKIETQRRLESVQFSARKTYFDYAKECLEAFKRKKSDWNALVAAFGGTAKDANWHFYRTRFPPEQFADGVAASEQTPSLEASAPPPSDDVLDVAFTGADTGGNGIGLEHFIVQPETPSVPEEVADSNFDVPVDRAMLMRLAHRGEWVSNNLANYQAGRGRAGKGTYPDAMCGMLLRWADEDFPGFVVKYLAQVEKTLKDLEQAEAARAQKELERQEKLREKEEAKVQARRDDNRPIHQHFEKLLA